MKRTVNRLKRLIALLFLAVAMVFGGCGVEPHPAVGELSSEKATEIRQVYYDQRYRRYHDKYAEIENIKILVYYGNYHGCELILVRDGNLMRGGNPEYFDTNEENIVNKVYTYYGLTVYLEPEFYPDEENNVLYISTAYEQGYFTKEDIKELDNEYGCLKIDWN